MKESFGGGEFLKKKYDLQSSPEVEAAAKRTEARTGEAFPLGSAEDADKRIRNYLDRFNEILDREDPKLRERGVEALKRVLHRTHVVKPDEIPEGYFENQRRIAREQGHGDVEVSPELREQLTEVIIADQKSSLDTWVDYFASPDAKYPDWLKYWATRSVLGMGEYDKDKKRFTRRSKGTTKPFADLNREALACVLDAVEKKYRGENISIDDLEAEDKRKFDELLKAENFPKLYAWAIDKVTPATKERLENVEGEWKTYKQGSDHMPLVESLQGHGTGWCTAGEETAKRYLQQGDLHVYYSLDAHRQPTVPRVGVCMRGAEIAEVRGVAENQNLDPYIGGVVQAKMKEFPDGKAYEKKAGDMKRLTLIEKKTQANQPLDKNDLRFLYELDTKIEGFGYGRDPRIKEIRDNRNPKEDAPILFGCAPQEIAWSQKDVNETTKAYVGPLFPGVFDTLAHLEHLYTSFPEGRIERRTLEIGGKTPKEYEKDLAKGGHKIDDYAKDLLAKMPVSEERAEAVTVRLKVSDLGFTKMTRYDKICERAKELGLELSPAEVGPALRLSLKDQPMDDWFRVAMEPIADRGRDPRVFYLERRADGSWLYTDGGYPGSVWHPDNAFVFVVRKQNLDS